MQSSYPESRPVYKIGWLKWVVAVIFIIAIVLFLSSCTHYIQSAHGGRVHSNAAYRSLYHNPAKKHSPKWYSRNQIYWFYTPAAHPTDIPIKNCVLPHSHKYLFK
jgi:hypothetical protein